MKELIPFDNQLTSFTQDITLGTRTVKMTFYFNSRFDRWHMDIQDLDGNDILVGKVLHSNMDALIRCFDSRAPSGAIYPFDFSDLGREPGFENLGDDIQLVYDEDI